MTPPKVTWPARLIVLWLAWMLFTGLGFATLEFYGLYCEHTGCDATTLSTWLVSNFGPILLTIATVALGLSIVTVLVWHWWTIWRERRNANA